MLCYVIQMFGPFIAGPLCDAWQRYWYRNCPPVLTSVLIR